MLTSGKLKKLSLFIKAIGNFFNEISEIAPISEKEQEQDDIIVVNINDTKEIAKEIKEINLLVEIEISKFPKNKRLKEIKEHLDFVRRKGNQILENAIKN